MGHGQIIQCATNWGIYLIKSLQLNKSRTETFLFYLKSTVLFYFMLMHWFGCFRSQLQYSSLVPHSMWDLRSPTRDQTASPALESIFFITELPGKSSIVFLKAKILHKNFEKINEEAFFNKPVKWTGNSQNKHKHLISIWNYHQPQIRKILVEEKFDISFAHKVRKNLKRMIISFAMKGMKKCTLVCGWK